MGIPLYLAMSATEMGAQARHRAWFACHFSPDGPGLWNLPTALPPGSLLILDDSTPLSAHAPGGILEALAEAVEAFRCAGVVLDFERPPTREAADLALALGRLPCPVFAPGDIAGSGPVFLPPVPLLTPVEEYLRPWAGRQLLLDIAPSAGTFQVTAAGTSAGPWQPEGPLPHADGELCCHYRLEVTQDGAAFHLCRTPADLSALLARAEQAGCTAAIGLWQELHDLQQ